MEFLGTQLNKRPVHIIIPATELIQYLPAFTVSFNGVNHSRILREFHRKMFGAFINHGPIKIRYLKAQFQQSGNYKAVFCNNRQLSDSASELLRVNNQTVTGNLTVPWPYPDTQPLPGGTAFRSIPDNPPAALASTDTPQAQV